MLPTYLATCGPFAIRLASGEFACMRIITSGVMLITAKSDITDTGRTESQAEGAGLSHDLREGEAIFGLPSIPCWQESGIPPHTGTAVVDDEVLASFHGPRKCKCGRPYGIAYDLDAIERAGADPNEILLHELVHAWQLFRDVDHAPTQARHELEIYGYHEAPFELEARTLARQLNELGVRVWQTQETT